MAKVKSKWVCQQCGYESAGYLGKCPECGSWASFTEEVQTNLKPQNITPQGIANEAKPSLINDIHIGEEVRVLLPVIRESENQQFYSRRAVNFVKIIKRFYMFQPKNQQAN